MADKELRLWVEDQLYALLGEKIERIVSLLRTTRAIAGEGWAAQRAWHCPPAPPHLLTFCTTTHRQALRSGPWWTTASRLPSAPAARQAWRQTWRAR